MHKPSVDHSDVFADNPQEEKLNRGKKKKSNHDRRDARGKAIPKHQFVEQVAKPNQQTESRQKEPRHGSHSKRDLRVARDTKHREVIKGVEVILRYPRLSARLRVWDQRIIEAELDHQPTCIWIRIIDLPKQVDERLVVQAETRRVRY